MNFYIKFVDNNANMAKRKAELYDKYGMLNVKLTIPCWLYPIVSYNSLNTGS